MRNRLALLVLGSVAVLAALALTQTPIRAARPGAPTKCLGLDQSYDCLGGLKGGGRIIHADAGPVHITGPDGLVVDGGISSGGPVTVQASGDGARLLTLSTERSWSLLQKGTGQTAGLALVSEGGGGNKPFYIQTDGAVVIEGTNPADPSTLTVDGSMILQNSGDGARLLEFATERGWAFEQRGSGQTTGLALVSEGGGGNKNFYIETDGNVIIEGPNPTDSSRLVVDIVEIRGGADLAEPFMVSDIQPIPVGSALVIDDINPGKLKLSDEPYDRRIAGVASGANGLQPGLLLTQGTPLDGSVLVAMSGRVFAFATAKNGSIRPGDLLTTSDISGHLMKATDTERAKGAVVGKAMSILETGEGLVLTLINLQ